MARCSLTRSTGYRKWRRSRRASFFAAMTDSVERVISWRRTTCEQALYYRDHMREFVDKYAGEYILLQENEVKFHSESSYLQVSRRELAGDRPDQAIYLKYVDPDEAEGECFDVYERALADLARRGLSAIRDIVYNEIGKRRSRRDCSEGHDASFVLFRLFLRTLACVRAMYSTTESVLFSAMR